MITGIFCHYLPIYKDTNGNYCSTTLTDNLFQRYLQYVDWLFVATRVYSLNTTYQEAHQEKISLKKVRIVEFPNLSNPKIFFTRMLHEKKRLDKIINKCDLIFIRGGIIAQMGAKIAKKYGKPYLLECSGCAWDEYWHYNIIGKFLAPYMEYRLRKDTWNADYVVYVTEKWLQSRYPTKGKNTYASNVFLGKTDEDVLAKRLEKIKNKIDKKKIIIGTTGGVGNKAKGQQYVIRLISELTNQYDITYELVGSGSRKYLEDQADKYHVKDRIIFKGQLTHDEVLLWLDNIDIYIQPSMQEGLPRALVEAMSRACPAVGSTTAGIPELLEEKFIFKRGNVHDLKQVFIKVMKMDLSQPAKRNFEKAKEYEVEKLNERRDHIFKEYKKRVTGISL